MITDGTLPLPSGLVLDRHTTLDAFLTSGACVPSLAVYRPEWAPWRHLDITSPVPIKGKLFSASVNFASQRLYGIVMSEMLDPTESWTDESIDRSKRSHDRWLAETFSVSPMSNWPWGRLESSIDERTGVAVIEMGFWMSHEQLLDKLTIIIESIAEEQTASVGNELRALQQALVIQDRALWFQVRAILMHSRSAFTRGSNIRSHMEILISEITRQWTK